MALRTVVNKLNYCLVVFFNFNLNGDESFWLVYHTVYERKKAARSCGVWEKSIFTI